MRVTCASPLHVQKLLGHQHTLAKQVNKKTPIHHSCLIKRQLGFSSQIWKVDPSVLARRIHIAGTRLKMARPSESIMLVEVVCRVERLMDVQICEAWPPRPIHCVPGLSGSHVPHWVRKPLADAKRRTTVDDGPGCCSKLSPAMEIRMQSLHRASTSNAAAKASSAPGEQSTWLES